MSLIKRKRTPGGFLDTTWDFGDLQRRFQDLLSEWPGWESESLSVSDWRPSVNISDTSEEYRIEAELPGVKQEDMKVTMEDGVLTLQGERREEKEVKSKKYRRIESSYGSFLRRFTMPEDADEDTVEAKLENGLLNVRIARKAVEESKSKAKTIEIRS